MVKHRPVLPVVWMVIVSGVLAFTLDVLDTSRPLTLCFPSSVQSVLGEQGLEEGFCSRLIEPSADLKRLL